MKKLTIAVSLIGLMAASAQAQPANVADMKAEAKQRFVSLDTNNNGEVSHEEMMAEAARKFAEFDQDGNGILLLEELPVEMPLPPRGQRRLERMQEKYEAQGGEESGLPDPQERMERRKPTRIKFMARMDKDNNEQLDLEEFAAPMIKRYKRADINGDGTVSESEFDEMLERRPGKRRRGNSRGYGNR